MPIIPKPKKTPASNGGRMPPTHKFKPPEVEHRGKLFRVRDKNYFDQGIWGKVWAVNLDWKTAHKKKETVVGARLSRTARLEEMTEVNQGDNVDFYEVGNHDGSWTYEKYHASQQGADNAQLVPITPPPRQAPVRNATRPVPPLGAAQAAATRAAFEANQRRQRAQEAEKARAEANARLQEAQELAAPIDGVDDAGDDVGDVDDLLGGGGVSADDIAHATAQAQEPPSQ